MVVNTVSESIVYSAANTSLIIAKIHFFKRFIILFTLLVLLKNTSSNIVLSEKNQSETILKIALNLLIVLEIFILLKNWVFQII